MTQVYFSSTLTSFGAGFLLNRYRQVQGWRPFLLGIDPIATGTIVGMWSTLVFHLHYTLAPLAAIGATLISVAILGRRCPLLSQEPPGPGFTPEAQMTALTVSQVQTQH